MVRTSFCDVHIFNRPWKSHVSAPRTTSFVSSTAKVSVPLCAKPLSFCSILVILVYHSRCFVIQSCLTLCDPTNWSPPGSSVHDFSRQEYQNGLLCPLSGIFLTQGWNPYLLSLFCTMETLSLVKHFPREGCLFGLFLSSPSTFFFFLLYFLF